MIGKWLEKLSVEVEDRLLTQPLGSVVSGDYQPEVGGCLLQVATGRGKAGTFFYDLRHHDLPPWRGSSVPREYDALLGRFGIKRIANAIRNRILRNRLRRTLVRGESFQSSPTVGAR